MSNRKGNRWAVLIGVDYYIPGKARLGMKFHNLRGCVQDVNRVEEYLRTTSDIQPRRTYKLTATTPKPDSCKNKPEEPSSKWPTYENIINVLQEVTREAEPNDLVYIHYSGHGARARTIFSHLKASGGDLDIEPKTISCDQQQPLENAIRGEQHNALDEVLVPTDIACDGGRYLRDVEIACLLWGMTEKKLVVTVVLDSCHSGGGVRNENETMVRGIQTVDMNQLVGDKSVLPEAELNAAYARSVKDGKRAGQVPKHWLLESHGYAFLAACQADEFASEWEFDGKVQGLFTYCLIDTLHSGSHLTYHKLYDIVSLKVRRYNREQNLVLGGEGDRLFFNWGESQLFYAATIEEVLEMNPGKAQAIVRLKAGNAHGIFKGAVFDVWPKACSNFNASARLARFSVRIVEDLTSEAESVEFFRPRQIENLEPGCLALPLPQKRLKFVTSNASYHQSEALRTAREACERHGHTILEVDDQNVKEDFRIEMKDGHYEVLGGDGEQLQHIIPPLRIDSPGASKELVRLVTHIAKYYNLQNLKHNHAKLGSLAKDFSVELSKMPDGLQPRPRRWRSRTVAPPSSMQPFKQLDNGGDNVCQVADGTWVFLRMENKAERAVHIAVLNLESSWAIKQIYPGRPGAVYETLGPHAVLDLPLKMTITPDSTSNTGSKQSEIVDSFIVFVTDEPTSVRWLELPPLERGERIPGNAPDESAEKRAGAPFEETAREWMPLQKWTTLEVKICTKKR